MAALCMARRRAGKPLGLPRLYGVTGRPPSKPLTRYGACWWRASLAACLVARRSSIRLTVSKQRSRASPCALGGRDGGKTREQVENDIIREYHLLFKMSGLRARTALARSKK